MQASSDVTTSPRALRIHRTEWRWVVLWSVVALVLANVPYLIGVGLSTPENRFGGAVYGVEDVNSYFAKMRQGARGAWLFYIPYTAEEHPGTIIYIHYLLLGKVAALSGLSVELVYNLARVVCGALLSAAVYAFLSHWTPYLALRRIGFLLVVFSGGLGWLLTILGRAEWLGSLPLDLISPESYVFLTLYSPPHLALATACLLQGMLLVREGARQHEHKQVLLGTLVHLVAALIGAFYLVTSYAVLGVDWLVTAVRRRQADWQALGWLVLSGLPTALVLGYDLAYFTLDPVYSVWSSQNLVPSLHPLHYLAGYLIVGALAALGVGRVVRRRQWQLQLLLVWLGILPLLLAAPFSAQRRLIIGAQVPLGLFAAFGLAYGVLLPFGRSRIVRWLSRYPRYSRAGMRRWLVWALVGLTFLTNLLLILGSSAEVLGRKGPIFHNQDELQMLDWLRTHSDPKDTVLSSYETGNYVPAYAGNRVLLGLGPETIYAERKRGEVRRFFDAAENDAWRLDLLRQYGIVYVIVGPAERELGDLNPLSVPYLTQVYANQTYAVYEARGGP